MDKWENKKPKIVNKMEDWNKRIQEVTLEIVKRYEKKIETLKKLHGIK